MCDLGGFSEGTLRHPPADKQKYIENVVRTYLGLCDVPYLDAIAHPFNTGNTAPAALPADYPPRLLRELAAKMAEKKKVFDVMNDTIYWFSKSGVAPRTLTAQYVELVKLFGARAWSSRSRPTTTAPAWATPAGRKSSSSAPACRARSSSTRGRSRRGEEGVGVGQVANLPERWQVGNLPHDRFLDGRAAAG